MLMLVLIFGGFCAFVGAVLLVVAGWDVVGEYGRVAILAGLSTLSWGVGALAAKRRLDTGATVGRGLAFVFGAVALAYTFSLLHEPGRLALLVALTAATLAGGVAVGRRGAPLGGAALLALGSQLIWAVGAQCIHMSDRYASAGVVAALAAAVSAPTFALGGRGDAVVPTATDTAVASRDPWRGGEGRGEGGGERLAGDALRGGGDAAEGAGHRT